MSEAASLTALRKRTAATNAKKRLHSLKTSLPVIFAPNTIVKPFAVVIKTVNTPPTLSAMFGFQLGKGMTEGAVF